MSSATPRAQQESLSLFGDSDDEEPVEGAVEGEAGPSGVAPGGSNDDE